jgi:hypothetical protein
MRSYDYAVQVAEETLAMHDELMRLRDENEELREYRRKYLDLLNDNTRHSEHMMASMLKLALTPGVIEACQANQKEVQS